MERIDNSTYRCTVCRTKVTVAINEQPVTALVGRSGKPTERVVTVGDVEVHRCRFRNSDRPGLRRVRATALRTNGSAKPSAQVAQAVGMVSVQVGCRVEEAFTLMADRAVDMNCTLEDIAVAVIEHSIRFD